MVDQHAFGAVYGGLDKFTETREKLRVRAIHGFFEPDQRIGFGWFADDTPVLLRPIVHTKTGSISSRLNYPDC